MEYIDGEDLGSLLRRIGRLPPDKAAEMARRLCAGLAAAHAIGVLHGDLKPANVMIDGRGHARITDFGLAGLAGAIGPADIRAGTPAYMSPEQVAGKEVNDKSDIYALGLVLYEIFTGKRPFEASSLAEIQRQQQAGPPGASTSTKDIDPAIERVILRCLEPDPARRPASALSVAAALPGATRSRRLSKPERRPLPTKSRRQGRGQVFLRVPPPASPLSYPVPVADTDWAALFRAASIDPARSTPAQPHDSAGRLRQGHC